ncbi:MULTISPECIES: hypothetical protein [Bartonella]|uniref:hypothetical protein n=1 Tax=Bartonella TaxID=773 RepID=UPI002362B72D|nr:hypothetical protein [Bartonella grahamii]
MSQEQKQKNSYKKKNVCHYIFSYKEEQCCTVGAGLKEKFSLVFLSNKIVQAVVDLSYLAYAVNTVLSGVMI